MFGGKIMVQEHQIYKISPFRSLAKHAMLQDVSAIGVRLKKYTKKMQQVRI